jgi:hypothetical protein
LLHYRPIGPGKKLLMILCLEPCIMRWQTLLFKDRLLLTHKIIKGEKLATDRYRNVTIEGKGLFNGLTCRNAKVISTLSTFRTP